MRTLGRTRLATAIVDVGASSERDYCRVPGCHGVLQFDTDGNGRLVTWCKACEKRVEQLQALLATRRAPPPAPQPPSPLSNEELLAQLRERFVTISEAAALLNQSKYAVTSRVTAGSLESTSFCTLRLIPRAALESVRWYKHTAREVLAALPTTAATALSCRELSDALERDPAVIATTVHKLHVRGRIVRVTDETARYRYYLSPSPTT